MTDISNNARTDGVYYYEPQGRINQMSTWSKEICELPISEYQKQYMVIKIIYDSIELATRFFQPGYIDEVRKTVPDCDYQIYLKRISRLDRFELTNRILREGNALFESLFGHTIADCADEGLIEYDRSRKAALPVE